MLQPSSPHSERGVGQEGTSNAGSGLMELLDFLFGSESTHDKTVRNGERPPGRSVWVDIHGNIHNVYSRDPVPPCSYRACFCKDKR